MSVSGENNSDLRKLDFTVSAPGKLILFGEHSVVYGKSALAACINKRTFLKFNENDSNQRLVTIKMKELDFDFSFAFKDIISIIKEKIPGYNGALQSNSVRPTDIDHDKFVSVIQGYINKYIGEQFNAITKHQQASLMVFLYLLHGIFYKENIKEGKSSIIRSFTIDVSSELVVGAGTGSSASFCVCVAAALYYYKNVNKCGLSDAKTITFNEKGLDVISMWAFNGEKLLHGKPSGIDNTVATFGSFVEVETKRDILTNELIKSFRNLRNPPKINVLLISTGVLRNTMKLIERAAVLKSKYPVIFDHILNGMHEISLKAIEIINSMGNAQIKGQPSSSLCHLETLVDMNQGLLYSMGVSHEYLQEICIICSRHGLHAKLTGAGGGGYAFALVAPDFDSNILAKCIDDLKKNGYSIYTTELGSNGVTLEE